MKRMAFVELEQWKTSPNRKPLLIRGARQVGKTYLVRQLGEQFEHFVEINLEYHQKSKKIFEYNLDPHRITRELSVLTGKKIFPGKTLLFLDEIQEAPKALWCRYPFKPINCIKILVKTGKKRNLSISTGNCY